MLATTDAIVLSLQPYSDKAHILHAYTRAGGRVNYKVYGLGRKHAIGLYTPLSLIQITADYPTSGLPTVRETTHPSSITHHQSSISTDPYKRTIALFISEVLYHVLRHPMEDEILFEYLIASIESLEHSVEPSNFHIHFLTGLAAKLGFAMEQEPVLPGSRAERQKTLRDLCAYFEEHVETWQEPKSLDILMAVFD